jgi:hypothetical protein
MDNLPVSSIITDFGQTHNITLRKSILKLFKPLSEDTKEWQEFDNFKTNENKS